MSLSRRKLYTIIFIACIAGFIWLYLGITTNKTEMNSVDVCLIKHVTNIPCPSCGSTRAIISLTKGKFIEAFMINPLGYVVAIIMLLAPLWIIVDLSTKNKTFIEFYNKIELKLKNPRYAIPLILLVIVNWIWNITKGL